MENQRERFAINKETFSDEFVEEILSDWSLSEINLTTKRKRLLAVLLHISGIRKKREFFADNLWLSEVSGYSDQSNLINALRKLEDMGLIERKSGMRGKASEYRIPYGMEGKKPVILEKASNKKASNKKASKTAENPVLIEADDKKGSKNEKTGVIAKKASTDTDIYTDIDLYKNNIINKIKEIDKNNINFLREFSDMKTELTKLKENLSVIENKLTEIVKETVSETVTSYLSNNLKNLLEDTVREQLEKTVRNCFSDLVTEHLQKESLNPNKGEAYGKKSEAPSSPVLEKEVKVPCPSPTVSLNLSRQEKKQSEAQQSPADEKQGQLPSGRLEEPSVKEEQKRDNKARKPQSLQKLLKEIADDPEVNQFFEEKVFDKLGRFSEDLSTKMSFVNTMHNGCNSYFKARRSTSTFFPDEKKRNYVRMLLHKYLYAIVNTTLSPESITKNTTKNGAEAEEESARLRKRFKEQYLQRYALEKDK